VAASSQAGSEIAHLHALCWLVRSVSWAARAALEALSGAASTRRFREATKASIESAAAAVVLVLVLVLVLMLMLMLVLMEVLVEVLVEAAAKEASVSASVASTASVPAASVPAASVPARADARKALRLSSWR
jgi:hypothetical protein